MKRLLPVILLISSLGSAAHAAMLSRVLKTFDFEERRLGNDESLPMNWTKVAGPGLPHYVNGRLSTDRHRSGDYSFRFDLNGGSLIYRYGPKRIPVQRGAHYRIDAWCQTTPLAHARARITAYLTDVDGRVLPNTVRHSALYSGSGLEEDAWKRLSVEVSADTADADSLVLELELLQPELYSESRAGDRPLYEQDIHGSVWWDDVTVSQVPELSLRTGRPGNVFARGEPVRLAILVSDRSTADLIAQLSVRDAEGREVYQRTGRPDVRPTQTNEAERAGMILELPPLRPGWYQARLTMNSGGQLLGAQSLAFIILPDDGTPIPPDGRFGFVATDLPFDAWDRLPELLPMLSAGRVKLAVWGPDGDVEQSHGPAFDRLLTRLSELGITPTACLIEPPPDILARLHGGWTRILTAPRSAWQPDLAFLVSQHANHLDRWQIGADGSSAFVADPQMREVYRRVLSEFSGLVDRPDLAMPWPAYYELAGDLPATVAMDVPASILPEQLPLYIQEIRRHTDHHLSLTLELLDGTRYGRDVAMRDLARRVIYALAAGAQRIDLPLPFSAEPDRDGIDVEPKEQLLLMRTLIGTLSGAQYKGSVSIADGVEAFLFDRGGRGILAMWDRGASVGARELSLNLGESPACVDLWGNSSPLLPSRTRKGTVAVTVGPMPIFLVGIDGAQAQLRASLAIDRPMIESSFRPHTRRIRFTNPYPQGITGSMHIKAPNGWTFDPPTINFSLNPGETLERDVTIQFPYNSTAGPKTLDCVFILDGQINPVFTVPLTVRLGLSNVGMQTLAVRQGADIFVQQMITNYGDTAISYSAFATYPNQARQERMVTYLAPGATTIRRYRFLNVDFTSGTKLRVGLKELGGLRILNDEVTVQ